MAKSKEYIRPLFPKDFSNIIREAKTTESVGRLNPGTIVRRSTGSNELVEEVDTTDLTASDDIEAGVELVWTDMVTRFDANKRAQYDKDNSTVNEYFKLTCVTDDFIADVKTAELFDSQSTVNVGDSVIKSRNEVGKLEAVDSIADAVSNDANLDAGMVPGMKVGVVTGDGDQSGFMRVQFTLA